MKIDHSKIWKASHVSPNPTLSHPINPHPWKIIQSARFPFFIIVQCLIKFCLPNEWTVQQILYINRSTKERKNWCNHNSQWACLYLTFLRLIRDSTAHFCSYTNACFSSDDVFFHFFCSLWKCFSSDKLKIIGMKNEKIAWHQLFPECTLWMFNFWCIFLYFIFFMFNWIFWLRGSSGLKMLIKIWFSCLSWLFHFILVWQMNFILVGDGGFEISISTYFW